MIKRLLEMYEAGSITGYQVMIDCLGMIDPDNPDPILSVLPDEILDEMMAYIRRYDPHRPHSTSLIPPAEDQVRTAERWIRTRRTVSPSAMKL